MGRIIIPRDCRGNELFVGNECYVLQKFPFIFKVAAVENGGIQTPQGITPAHVRVVADISLRQIPGVPFESIIRTVSPDVQKVVEDLASRFKLPEG